MTVTSKYSKSKSKFLLTSKLIEQSKDFIFYRWTTAGLRDIDWRKDTKKSEGEEKGHGEKYTFHTLWM